MSGKILKKVLFYSSNLIISENHFLVLDIVEINESDTDAETDLPESYPNLTQVQANFVRLSTECKLSTAQAKAVARFLHVDGNFVKNIFKNI